MHYLMTTERENLKGGSMYYGCQEEEYTDMVSSVCLLIDIVQLKKNVIRNYKMILKKTF